MRLSLSTARLCGNWKGSDVYYVVTGLDFVGVIMVQFCHQTRPLLLLIDVDRYMPPGMTKV